MSFSNPDELLRKIRLGEDSMLELKHVAFKGKRSDPHQDSLVAYVLQRSVGGGPLLEHRAHRPIAEHVLDDRRQSMAHHVGPHRRNLPGKELQIAQRPA